ncbi:MAG TPA: Asp-tRNA(Asn)/Glu-tRNA(Gln) amidotransferase subunit GatC [Gemmatimonadaceae bacterium]|nr:Asp-tRNA(Asn)/Glu-tRNA(Gln) amidotransferase subunit GatC [Gemmatimonadaceae bacterium]
MADTQKGSVTVSDVRHVAALARLGISDARAAELTRELNTILEHMTVLGKVDTQGVSEASGVGAAGMRLRPDDGPPIPMEARPEAFAPEMRAGFFLVPRLATHEDAEPSS